MAELVATVHRDLIADIIVVKVVGLLSVATVPRVRTTLLKCVAECPTAIIVDLSRCEYTSAAMLTVFPAVARTVRPQPTVALLAWRPGRELPGRERAALGPVACYPTMESAVAAASAARTLIRRSVDHLPRSAAAPGRARAIVREVCDRWDVGSLRTPAELIISELVTNGVTHAGTDVELDVALRNDFLHMRVRDESTVQPVPRMVSAGGSPTIGGRGLYLVGLYSTAWGYVVGATGKVVWATLRARPIGPFAGA